MKELKYFYKTSNGKGYLADYVPHKEEGLVEITKEEWDAHLASLHHEPTAAELAKREKRSRIAFLKRELARTDYEAIKYSEGEMSAEDYESYKVQRRAWRAEINQLEGELE